MTKSESTGSALDVRFIGARIAIGIAKRWGVLCVGLIGVCALALLIAPQVPRNYESEATIQLRKSLATATSENAGLQPAETDGKITEDYREVQTELLQSNLLYDAVAARLLAAGWTPEPSLRTTVSRWVSSLRRDVGPPSAEESRVALAGQLAEATHISRPLKSPIVVLRAEHSDPRTAQRILELLLIEYEASLRVLYDVSQPLEAARTQVAEARSTYESQLAEFEQFQISNGIFNPDPELESANTELVELGKALAQRRAEFQSSLQKMESMEATLKTIPAHFAAEPTRVENKNRVALLNLLEAARKRLMESPFVEGTAEHQLLLDPVVVLEQELKLEQPFVVAENPPTPNSGYLHFQTLLGEARAAVPAAKAALQAVEQRIAEQVARIERIGELRSQFERHRDAVLQARSALDDAREQEQRIARVNAMALANQLWSLRVIQEPSLPTRPKSFGWKVICLALIAGGGLLAIGLVAWLGWRDPLVSSAVEVKACVGAPPVLALPDIRKPRERREVLRHMGSAKDSILTQPSSGPLLYNSLGAAARFFENRLDELLASIVPDSNQQGRPLAIAVCGAHAGAGASTLAANLALRLARRGEGDVLLLRIPAHSAVHMQVSNALPGVDGLELDMDKPFELAEIGREYAYVVIDGAPVLETDIALTIYRHVDACLLVASCDVTHKAVLSESARVLISATRGRVGVVLNKMRFHLPASLLTT